MQLNTRVMWVAVFTAGMLHVVRSEIFSASADLSSVFEMEKHLVTTMHEFIGQAQRKIQLIQKYLDQYQALRDENVQTEEDFVEKISGNPVHAYQLMRRLTVEWKDIDKELQKDDWTQVLQHLKAATYGKKFPEEDDMHGAAQALIRLQDTYELNITELTRGNVWGMQGHADLTAQDCLFMGKHCFNARLYSRAVEWFEEAFVLAGLENNRTVRQDQVAQFLDLAIKRHDESWESGQIAYVFPEPLHKVPISEQRELLKQKRNYRIGKNTADMDNLVNFNALCRGERLLDEKYVAKLKCRLDRRRHPYFTLMPVKLEQQHLSPAIYTFHDVLTDKEIEVIKEIASPKLARATVQGQTGTQHVVSNTRTSKTAWFGDHSHSLLPKLSHRISMLTGLSTNTADGHSEMLQVANYGIGGHYSPHYDYLMKDKPSELVTSMPEQEIRLGDRIATFMFYLPKKFSRKQLEVGDRIATFMFYLNDVTRGGATAFPKAGVAITPVKGAAAFWWNLKKSGKPDILTLHGACPVVYGSKWVSNKWIRETAQTFNRPCSLDIND